MEGDIQPKSLKQAIPKIYRRDLIEKVLFGWVQGQRVLVQSRTIEEAIRHFYKYTGFTESDISIESAKTTYKRMVKEYYDSQKTGNAEKAE